MCYLGPLTTTLQLIQPADSGICLARIHLFELFIVSRLFLSLSCRFSTSSLSACAWSHTSPLVIHSLILSFSFSYSCFVNRQKSETPKKKTPRQWMHTNLRHTRLFFSSFYSERERHFLISLISFLSELEFWGMCHYYYYIRRAICAGVFDISL